MGKYFKHNEMFDSILSKRTFAFFSQSKLMNRFLCQLMILIHHTRSKMIFMLHMITLKSMILFLMTSNSVMKILNNKIGLMKSYAYPKTKIMIFHPSRSKSGSEN